MRRILKPNGILAIWGYDVPNFPSDARANDVFAKLYTVTMGPYWSSQRRHIDNHYAGSYRQSYMLLWCAYLFQVFLLCEFIRQCVCVVELSPPSQVFDKVQHLEMDMTKEMNLQQLV